MQYEQLVSYMKPDFSRNDVFLESN